MTPCEPTAWHVVTRFTVTGDAAVMSANRVSQLLPMQRARLDREWQDKAIVGWARAKRPTLPCKDKATIQFHVYRARPMDADNLIASRCLKEIVDGLVLCGALAGDGPDLLDHSPTVLCWEGPARVEVTIIHEVSE